jgi:hypothetical protein
MLIPRRANTVLREMMKGFPVIAITSETGFPGQESIIDIEHIRALDCAIKLCYLVKHEDDWKTR